MAELDPAIIIYYHFTKYYVKIKFGKLYNLNFKLGSDIFLCKLQEMNSEI